MANVSQIAGNRTFSEIPKYKRKRIFGTENEYGVIGISPNLKNQFIQNGGKIYIDSGHLEYASPETSNPLEAVVYEKAGELLCKPLVSKIYKNNIDSLNNTFGAHENYFTKTEFTALKEIIPFLITRQIFAGSGNLDLSGIFNISQRSKKMECTMGVDTTRQRCILCTKKENHSNLEGWIRLHLILGDANMCEIADFLKMGTTALVLDLIEDNLLPQIKYNLEFAIKDLYNISDKTENWTVRGTLKEEKATDIQRLYLESASKSYKGRDEITDEILARWENTLNALDEIEDNPMRLVGELDWVTKKALIEAYAQKNNLKKDDYRLRNINLQYHDLDRDKSLFYVLQKQDKIERLITDELIENAKNNPPKDTRANIRSLAVKKGMLVDWSIIGINNILNPFETYAELESRL